MSDEVQVETEVERLVRHLTEILEECEKPGTRGLRRRVRAVAWEALNPIYQRWVTAKRREMSTDILKRHFPGARKSLSEE